MPVDLRYFSIARIVLETRTPLAIGTGASDGVFDTTLVRDANGLPAIPGSSVAGVLRHGYQQAHGEAETKALFGFADDQHDDGHASHVHVSWGCLHNSNNVPVEGLLLDSNAQKQLTTDTVLREALKNQPNFREHVRLNHRGVAHERGKFDQTSLPAGHRFSIELCLWSAANNDPRWQQLLALLTLPHFRLGAATRRGYGAFEVKRCATKQFDMREAKHADAYRRLSPSIGDIQGLQLVNPTAPSEKTRMPVHKVTVALTAEDFWRFGGGEASLRNNAQEKPADMLPVAESTIQWTTDNTGKDKGRLAARRLLIPASGIKGALAHRVAFHYNCLTRRFATQERMANADTETNPGVRELFGCVKDSAGIDLTVADDHGARGQAGRVLIDDVFVSYKPEDIHTMMHNSIDRFTGGVRDGMLFCEELVYKKGFSFQITLLPPPSNARETPIDHDALRALDMALADLVEGRLALGAASSKGHGYFNGKLDWPAGAAKGFAL